jgi:hypothetical protein
MIRQKPRLVFFALMLGFIVSAHAGNSYVGSGTCACTTTSDFIYAAEYSNATYDHASTTYTISSTTTNETAIVYVAGSYQWITDPGTGYQYYVYVVSSATPTDASGTSIAGQSEATQESTYQAIDTTIYAGDRDVPYFKYLDPNATPTLLTFINSTDYQVTNAVMAQNTGGPLTNGQLVTVIFHDGTRATFRYNSSTGQLEWTGDAWDANGKPMNRDGTLKANPNTAGGANTTGNTTAAYAPDVVNGGNWSYVWAANSQCVDVENFEQGGVIYLTQYFWVPCH